MRRLIIGGGSMGLLLASKLAPAGYQLCTHHAEQAQAIARDGLIRREGDVVQRVAVATTEWQSCLTSGQTWDVLLLTMKQPQLTPTFLSELQTLTHAGTQLVAFQNGMGHADLLLTVVKKDQLWLAVSTDGANRMAVNEVAYTGRGVVKIGRADDPAMINECWTKLVANAIINPLTAIHRVRNGALLHEQAYFKQMRQLFEEIQHVAQLEQVVLTEQHWQFVLNICQSTAANESSMLQDVKRGIKTEIQAINGYLLQLAKKHQITLPAHEEVVNLLT
jgi:2-dehydropantoate 2-reductase